MSTERNAGFSNPSDGIPERWRPLRDENGNAITLTEDQVRAVWHAIHAVELVREREGYPPLHEESGFAINAAKSRLLGRLLIEGKPPHLHKPPKQGGGPAWWLVEGEAS